MMKKKLQQPLFIAHRGISARYPENTLAAFIGAIDVGAHMIELDVCLSKDRHLVVSGIGQAVIPAKPQENRSVHGDGGAKGIGQKQSELASGETAMAGDKHRGSLLVEVAASVFFG